MMLRRQRRPAQYSGLFFLVGANLLEYRDLNPKPAAALALAHGFRANRDRCHLNLTARTFQNRQWRGRSFGRRGAAMRTVLAADEHHGETGWTRNRGQL